MLYVFLEILYEVCIMICMWVLKCHCAAEIIQLMLVNNMEKLVKLGFLNTGKKLSEL